MERKTSGTSDEGYNSDLPSPTRDFSRDELRIITKDAKELKEKYLISEMINNSANGVIYQGKHFLLILLKNENFGTLIFLTFFEFFRKL